MANEHATYVFSVFKVLSLEMNPEIRSRAVSGLPAYLLLPLFFKPTLHKLSQVTCPEATTGVCWPEYAP